MDWTRETSEWDPKMARIVMKFGGTSVAGLDRIRNAATRVKAEVDRGNEVAVAVSAMAGETNRLVALVTDISKLHDAREYDVVVSAGEPWRCNRWAYRRGPGSAGSCRS